MYTRHIDINSPPPPPLPPLIHVLIDFVNPAEMFFAVLFPGAASCTFSLKTVSTYFYQCANTSKIRESGANIFLCTYFSRGVSSDPFSEER